MDIKEKHILFNEIYEKGSQENLLPKGMLKVWEQRIMTDYDMGKTNERVNNKRSGFNFNYTFLDKVCTTLTPRNSNVIFDEPRVQSKEELLSCGSW